ncbi:MAG: undecaprenyldiphospho-muramoylpentapeptide beta-N-acetylglucosaminyltransferase [Rhodospirillales bacterium]|nr:undecaprenyldiphospho-muramoylpentapeptide beta-N-acetylglucosaminyltransferase [Acetobacter sp.]
MSYSFVLTGGGTGGHIFPALAVADVLRSRGHKLLFVGTAEGMEARLVPQAGYPIEFVRSGGLNRVGFRRSAQTLLGLPKGIWSARRLLHSVRPSAVFSMGGYVAGPVMLAAVLGRIPLVIMEPNAVPGFANRQVARYVYRALLGFKGTEKWFRPGRTEVTGLPVRAAFFAVSQRTRPARTFTVLITGGSRGARKLNRAVRDSWPLFAKHGIPLRLIQQTGAADSAEWAQAFAQTGLQGEVVPFITDMADAFAGADLVVGRSGAGAVNEIAAAGMPSLLIPFPFAADNHQQRNAEMLVNGGAACMILDRDLTGERLFSQIESLRSDEVKLRTMKERVIEFAKPGAAERAADVLQEAAAQRNRGA